MGVLSSLAAFSVPEVGKNGSLSIMESLDVHPLRRYWICLASFLLLCSFSSATCAGRLASSSRFLVTRKITAFGVSNGEFACDLKPLDGVIRHPFGGLLVHADGKTVRRSINRVIRDWGDEGCLLER